MGVSARVGKFVGSICSVPHRSMRCLLGNAYRNIHCSSAQKSRPGLTVPFWIVIGDVGADQETRRGEEGEKRQGSWRFPEFKCSQMN